MATKAYTITTKKCPVCKKTFASKRDHGKYCSLKCKGKARRERDKKNAEKDPKKYKFSGIWAALLTRRS